MDLPLQRKTALLSGQMRVLELIAKGAALETALDELVRFIEAQDEGLTCGILIVSDDGEHFRRGSGPDLPEHYHQALDGVPITPPYLGACGEAAHCGSSVSVPDVANDERWSEQWRDLILSCGLYACLSTPVRGADGRVLASFAMYYDHARDPEPTEPELVEIATHLAAIALEREREAQARSKVQAAHRENEERLSQIIDSAREYAIFTLDGSGCITSWNEGARRLLGYDDNEASGQPGEIFFTPEDRAAGIPAEEMKTALSKGRAANERWHLRKDGSRFWGSGVMLPVERTGRDAFLKIFRDRTHERLEEEHRKLLINELNHRVKNTLATVQSITAQTLRIGGGTGDSCRAGRSPRGAFAGP